MFYKKLKILFLYLRYSIFYKHLFFKLTYKFKKKRNNLSKFQIEKVIHDNFKVFYTNEFIEKFLKTKFFKFSDLNKKEYDNAHKISKQTNIKMGGGANIDLLYLLIKKLKYVNIIETGVAYGWSSLSILSALNDIQNSKLISIDMPYPDFSTRKHIGCVVPNYLRKNWQLINMSDRSALPKVLSENTFDLCHYDSDKSYYGRTWAYNLIWKNLNKNGALISDDISDNTAFLDFTNLINVKPIIIKYNNKFIGIIFK